MPLLPARRNSLCLFCSVAAQLRPPPQRLLPRLQAAHASTQGSSSSSSNNNRRNDRFFSRRGLEFNPLTSQNPIRSPKHPRQSLSSIVHDKLLILKAELGTPEFLESLHLTSHEFATEWDKFEKSMHQWIRKEQDDLKTLAAQDSQGKGTLETRLRYLFYAQACGGRFTLAELENQKAIADLRYPAEWYPATRQIQRTVHLHVGPTNSGKTYHALKRLEEVESGIYLGPLRLLAHEVYTRLNAKGKTCALVTGEEQRLPDGETAKMYSCTVEMAPLNSRFDVAVIDEIQMINHQDRGWAWTQAFLGIMANEIHLCGEARTVPLIRELCATVGDKVHVHEYERLTPLQVAPRSLNGKLSNLTKGDCVVAFTVMGIHALRREIEKKTGKKCAIVYGSLPPETRAQQARLFNDPDNDYDFLVASDAIGMGLNLAIKRVIFESVIKNNGVSYVPLQVSEMKQIAGRAGRYKTAHQAITADESKSIAGAAIDDAIDLDDTLDEQPKLQERKTIGWVTTLEPVDHPTLKRRMEREPEPITTAGLFPPSLIVERFAMYFPPGTPFSYILLRLHEISEIHPRFHLCALKDQLAIADAIHTIKDLSIQDRITICAAPINMRDKTERAFLQSLAACIAEGRSGDLLDLDLLPLEVMDENATGSRKYLYSLEQLHKNLVAYLWLSYRFPNVFTSRTLANYTKKLVEDQIENTLTEFSHTKQAMERLRRRRELARKESGEEVDDEQSVADAQASITNTEGPEDAGLKDDISNLSRVSDRKDESPADLGQVDSENRPEQLRSSV